MQFLKKYAIKVRRRRHSLNLHRNNFQSKDYLIVLKSLKLANGIVNSTIPRLIVAGKISDRLSKGMIRTSIKKPLSKLMTDRDLRPESPSIEAARTIFRKQLMRPD